MKKKQVLKLPVRLTDEELTERRKAQGAAQQKLELEEDAARASARKHKALVKTAVEVFYDLARVVSSGEEMRDVECKRAEDGLLYRLDTGELVKESFGSAEDRTLPLPLDEGDDLGEPAGETPSGVVLERPKKAKGKKAFPANDARELLAMMKPGEWYTAEQLVDLSGWMSVHVLDGIEFILNSPEVGEFDEVKAPGKGLRYRYRPRAQAGAAQ